MRLEMLWYRINVVLDVEKTEIKTIILIFVYVIICFIFNFKYLYTCINSAFVLANSANRDQYGLYLDLHCYAFGSRSDVALRRHTRWRLVRDHCLTIYILETPFNAFANSADSDQAALRAAWSGSALFAHGNMIRYDPTLVDRTSKLFVLC